MKSKRVVLPFRDPRQQLNKMKSHLLVSDWRCRTPAFEILYARVAQQLSHLYMETSRDNFQDLGKGIAFHSPGHHQRGGL